MSLLLVSIGPIQDFIASARRCQDLWFGSWLLSELARAAAARMEEVAGRRSLIFPGSLEGDGRDRPSVANKILVVVPQGRSPMEVATEGRKALQERLTHLAQAAFDKVDPPRAQHLHREAGERQVSELMEYLWVAVPCASDDTYKAARNEAEWLLAARKNTRVWGQPSWDPGVGVLKSSLDGQRESVLDERLYDDVRHKRMTPESLRKRYFVKPAERLCGVGLLKRVGEDVEDDVAFGVRRPTFHSTSHVAAAPLLVRLARAKEVGRKAWERYEAALRDLGIDVDRFRVRLGAVRAASLKDPTDASSAEVRADRTFGQRGAQGFDGELLFRDRLPEVVDLYSSTDLREQPVVAQATRALHELFQALGHLSGIPTPYYAVLLADGDRMGAAIDALGGIERHRALSDALTGFATGCDEIVAGFGGSLVYSGGDDVLALLPLHTALACAERLRKSFAEALGAVIRPEDGIPTLSVGLGIAHHREPMADARALAKRAESLAKGNGRNSLGIVLALRSGATLELVGRWDESPNLTQRIIEWCRRLGAEEVPDAVAYEIAREIAPFEVRPAGAAPLGEENTHRRGNTVAALVKRAVVRRRAKRGAKPMDDGQVEPIVARVSRSKDPLAAARAVSVEVQVARLFLDALNDAWGPIDEAQEEE